MKPRCPPELPARQGYSPVPGHAHSTLTDPAVPAHRVVRYRLPPGDAATGNALMGTAGAARFPWNLFVDLCQWRHRLWKADPVGPRPSVSFFTLGRLFTQIRNGHPDPWLAAVLKQVRPDIEDYRGLKAYAANCLK